MVNGKIWTQREVDFLKKNYGKIFGKEIARVLQRTVNAIKMKARKLKLRVNRTNLIKGKNNPMWNRHHTKKTKEIIRLANIGNKNNLGKKCLEKTKRKIGLKIAEARRRGCYIIKPTQPERQMKQIIKENKFHFNYTGNGKVIMGGFNPDFLSYPPKYIIEVFGDYWHNLPRYKKTDKRRLRTYASLGYKTLVVWEHELREPQEVAEKIFKFVKADKKYLPIVRGFKRK